MLSWESALSVITAVFGTSIFGGWFAWLATTVQRRKPEHDRSGEVVAPGPSRADPHACGDPDLPPLSAPSAAGAELAELELLWRLPTHRGGTGGDP